MGGWSITSHVCCCNGWICAKQNIVLNFNCCSHTRNLSDVFYFTYIYAKMFYVSGKCLYIFMLIVYAYFPYRQNIITNAPPRQYAHQYHQCANKFVSQFLFDYYDISKNILVSVFVIINCLLNRYSLYWFMLPASKTISRIMRI